MKKFRKVYVEITNICNMNCSFCPQTKRAKATMALENFEHIVKQIEAYTDYIYLHVKGEPLIHPKLKEILDICEKYNLKVNISTNATLLKDKWEMLKNIRQLNLSLHSFEKDDNEKLNEYLTDVLTYSDKLAKEDVIIRYKLWNESKESNKNSKIIQMLDKWYNVDIKSSSYAKDIKLMDNIYLSIKSPFKWPETEGENQKETTCYGLRHQIAILVDGTVVPCCVDNNGDIALGNIFKMSLEDILETDKAKKIKKGFEENKCIHSLCKKCEYRTYVI